MIDWILDRIREVDSVESVHVVTNSKFAGAFREWAPADVVVQDDGTTSEDDRLGAIGDIQFVVERAGLDDDLLIVAGRQSVRPQPRRVRALVARQGVASAVALSEVDDRELIKQYAVVELDEHERVVSFVEKPRSRAPRWPRPPASTTASTRS